MTDKHSSFWNMRSSSDDDDDYDADDSGYEEKASPFYSDDDDYGDDDQDSYSDYRSSRSSGSTYGRSSYDRSSSYGSGSRSSSYNRYSRSYNDDLDDEDDENDDRFSSSRRDRTYPPAKPRDSSRTSRTSQSTEKSSGASKLLGRFSRGKDKDRDRDKSRRTDRDKDSSKTRDSGGITGRFGALRKRLPGGSSERTPSTTSSSSTGGRASSTRTLSRYGSERDRSATTSTRADRDKRGKDKKESSGRSRFNISLPFGRKKDKADSRSKARESKRPPSTRRSTKKAKPLPSSARRPHIKKEGMSLDLKLDIAGWALIVGAAIIFFGAISSNQGDVSRTLLRIIYQFVGVGWVAVPIAMGGTGIWLIWRHFGDTAPEADYIHILGWLVTYLAALTTFHFVHLLTTPVMTIEQLQALSEQAAQAGYGGGWLGGLLYMTLMRSLGDVGTFFALVGWWGIGLLMATDISVADIAAFVSKIGRRLLTRYKLFRAERMAARRALTPTGQTAEGLPEPGAAALSEAAASGKALPEPEAIPVEGLAHQPRINYRGKEPQKVEAVTPASTSAVGKTTADSAGPVPIQPDLLRVRRPHRRSDDDDVPAAPASPERNRDEDNHKETRAAAEKSSAAPANEIVFTGTHTVEDRTESKTASPSPFTAPLEPEPEPKPEVHAPPPIDSSLMQPARPRDPERARRRRLRELRTRTTGGLSPAERAALRGDFAQKPAGSTPENNTPDDSEQTPPDEPVYEPLPDAQDTLDEVPVIEIEESEVEPAEPPEDEIEDSEPLVIDAQPADIVKGAAAPRSDPQPAYTPPAADPVLATVPEEAPQPQWEIPNFEDILDPAAEQNINDDILLDRARIIEDTLASFGAPGKVVEVNPGPVITQFGVEPDYIEGRGGRRTRVKVQAIARLADDLALALAARSIRIEAPVPGKGFVGIEVPNAETSLVSLRDVMESREFKKIDSTLRIGLGQSVDGTPVAADLTTMPHLLIAGTTGSGKSVCVNAIITCLLLQNTPDTLRFIMVDPKRVELTGYNGIPHLVAPVVVDLERIVGVLKWVTREMDDRYKKFNERGARNITDYNNRLGPDEKPLPYLIVVVDELADLMMLAPDETERVLTRLAQMSRATGIHLIISTQRPSVDVVTGLIKANFPARVAFAVASSVDSRVILDQPGAERLLGRGDMLFQAPDAAAPVRLQGVFVSEAELNRLVSYWKGVRTVDDRPQAVSYSSHTSTGSIPSIRSRTEKYGAPARNATAAPWENIPSASSSIPRRESDEVDELYDEAVAVVRRLKKASVSLLQRQLRIGYTRAARLIDVMEERGIVGPAQSGSKPRKVIGYTDEDIELSMDNNKKADLADDGKDAG